MTGAPCVGDESKHGREFYSHINSFDEYIIFLKIYSLLKRSKTDNEEINASSFSVF